MSWESPYKYKYPVPPLPAPCILYVEDVVAVDSGGKPRSGYVGFNPWLSLADPKQKPYLIESAEHAFVFDSELNAKRAAVQCFPGYWCRVEPVAVPNNQQPDEEPDRTEETPTLLCDVLRKLEIRKKTEPCQAYVRQGMIAAYIGKPSPDPNNTTVQMVRSAKDAFVFSCREDANAVVEEFFGINALCRLEQEWVHIDDPQPEPKPEPQPEPPKERSPCPPRKYVSPQEAVIQQLRRIVDVLESIDRRLESQGKALGEINERLK